MDAKKLINQKNYPPMNNKKITEMKTKEIKELQDNQISHVNESVGEQSWRAETEFSTNECFLGVKAAGAQG
jgi:hypothetical protein